MKNLTLTFMLIFAGLSNAQNSPAPLNEKAGRNFFVGIVVDSSPASTKDWNIRKSRAIELISNIDQGDKVIVLKARPGSPSVYGKTVISGPLKTGSNEIVSTVSVMNKELLSSADVARACESVYDIFVSEGSNSKCMLVVLTSGKLKDSQIQRILRTSSQIKMLGGSVSVTYDPAVANHNIINAGKKNDIEILLESNPDFAGWIRSKRDKIEPEKTVIEKTEYVFLEPNLTPITNMIKALTPLKPDVNTLIPPLTAQLPQVQETNIINTPIDLESNNTTTHNLTDINSPAEVNIIPKNISRAQTKPKSIAAWLILLIAAVVIAAIVLFIVSYNKWRNNTPGNHDADTTDTPSILKAIVGEQDINLGEIDLISELTMGNDPGCGIYIEDDQLPPQQARIFRTKKGFKLQNLDLEPVIVNGLEVKNKKKVKLDLPADIQLSNGMMINLYTETTPEIKDENNE
jgi:hypothetical protein